MPDTSANEFTLRKTLPVKYVDLGDGTYAQCIFPWEYKYQNIASATTTTVKSGPGILKKIVFNKFVASGVVTLYDNTSAAGTLIGTITLPMTLLSSQGEINYDSAFSTGLTIVTSLAFDLTVVYQ